MTMFQSKFISNYSLKAKFEMRCGFLLRPELIIEKFDSATNRICNGKRVLLVMLNPGGATPTLELASDGFQGVYPDPTLRRVIDLIDLCNISYCKVVNLYNVVCAKSSYLVKSSDRGRWLITDAEILKLKEESYDAVIRAYGKLHPEIETEARNRIDLLVKEFNQVINHFGKDEYAIHPMNIQGDGNQWFLQTGRFLKEKGISFEKRPAV